MSASRFTSSCPFALLSRPPTVLARLAICVHREQAMDLSAGGLAPTPRDGASSSQAVVDPLDAFLSPLGSPGLPTDAAAQAALRALRGEESESESSRRPSDSVGGRLEPSRAHASYNEDLKIKGSAGESSYTASSMNAA